MAETETRGTWGSRLAFIMAAAGSAIGLGNIWGFPGPAWARVAARRSWSSISCASFSSVLR